MIKILEQQLKDNGYDNHIYFGLTDFEIEKLKQFLKNDYGYIDIIINFDDSKKLNKLINSIPKDLDQNLLKSYIYEQYINYKILKESNISDKNIEITPSELENILFNDNFETFENMNFIMYMFLERALKKQAETKNSKTRLHLFLDEINDILLQRKINDLIYARQSLIFMSYTTKDYTTMDGSYIESPHDYRSFYQRKEKVLKKINKLLSKPILMLIIMGDDNMNILFTGAVSGIAHSVINELLKKNKYNIYLTVETDSQLKNIKERYKNNSKVNCFKLNVTNVKDRNKLKGLDIDILVSNAAIGYGGSISEIPMSKVRKNFEVNVFSNFEIIQIVLKNMIKNGKGRIIVMSSLAGIIPLNFLGSYSATKSSINTLTTTLRNELKLINKNIKVILIEPGMYHTGFNQVMLENKYDWMIKESYFKKNLDNINNKEKLMFSILEKRKLDSIVNKIMEAITTKNPKFIYRAPLTQVMGAKIYDLFFR